MANMMRRTLVESAVRGFSARWAWCCSAWRRASKAHTAAAAATATGVESTETVVAEAVESELGAPASGRRRRVKGN